MKKFLLSAALATAAITGASAAENNVVNFTYDNGTTLMAYGNYKLERCDAAICIKNPMLAGKKVKSVRVQMNDDPTEYYSDMSCWATTKLAVKNGQNVPNLTSATGKVEGDYYVVDFPESVEIPEEGIYLGYTVTVVNLKNKNGEEVLGATCPIPVVHNDAAEGSFWFHTNKTVLRWADMHAQLGAAFTMIAEIEGDFPDYDGSIFINTADIATSEENATINGLIYTYGAKDITEFDFNYEINGTSGDGHCELETPLEPYFGDSAPIKLTIPAITEGGTYEGTITLTKINGTEVSGDNKTAQFTYNAMAFVPVRRPLVEEFTGLWCGFCPRGFVALESMKEKYGDRFVAVAFHDGDPMATTTSFPVKISGYPMGAIDRNLMDPGYFYDQWPAYCANMPDVDISATIERVDTKGTDEEPGLKLTATTKFTKAFEKAGYRIGFYIVADGLRNKTWAQANYFANDPVGTLPSPYGDHFCGTGKGSVTGLTYNDVMAWHSPYNGYENALPENIEANTEYNYSINVPLTSIGIPSSANPFKNYDMMRAIAIIYDAQGKPINCATSIHLDYEAGIERIAEEDGMINAQVKTIEYFDLQGHKITRPESGIVIRRQTMTDGSIRTAKIVL